MNSLNFDTVFVHRLTRFFRNLWTSSDNCYATPAYRVSHTRYAVCHSHGTPCVTHTVCRVSLTRYAVWVRKQYVRNQKIPAGFY
jgi:hypothetical protein